ncbi:transposase [Streptacidiphilus sp. BW17]
MPGRKHHILVDCLGLLLVVMVTTASVHDRDAAMPLLERLRDRYRKITLVWADGGYAGRLVTWAKQTLRLTVQVVKRSDDVSRFVVLPRRWCVERTFAWLFRSRRLVHDYETLPGVHEHMVLWSAASAAARHLRRGVSHPAQRVHRSRVTDRTVAPSPPPPELDWITTKPLSGGQPLCLDTNVQLSADQSRVATDLLNEPAASCPARAVTRPVRP